MQKNPTRRKWLWYFSLIAALIVLYKLCDDLPRVWSTIGWIAGILMPFIVGFILAALLYTPCAWLERQILRLRGRFWKKTARAFAMTLVYLALVGIVSLIIYLIGPLIVDSVTSLISSLPSYIEAAKERFDEFARPGGLLDRLSLADRLDGAYQALIGEAQKLLTAENLLTAIRGVVNVTGSIINAVITIMVSIYLLAAHEKLTHEAKLVMGLFMKPRHIGTVWEYGHRIIVIFNSYLYGAFADALTVGTVVSVGLLIFRVPYAVLLGMGLGLLNMIPYFGSTIGGIVISLITLLTKNIYAALGVALFIIVVQQIDSNIIEPHIVGDSVGLRPIYVLLGITLFGGLFGFWGIFLGVPLMAIIQMFVKDAIARRAAKAQSASAEEDAPAQDSPGENEISE